MPGTPNPSQPNGPMSDCPRDVVEAVSVPMRRLDAVRFQHVVAELFPGLDAGAAFPPAGKGAPFSTSSIHSPVTAIEAEPIAEAAFEVALGAAGRLPTCSQGLAECATSTLRPLATKAFRRAPSDAELTSLRDAVLEAADAGVPWPESGAVGVLAMLQTPQFLYLSEPAASAPFSELDGERLAEQLSMVLTDGLPDDTVRTEAAALRDGERRRVQAARLLATPAGRATTKRFLRQWLGIDDFHSMVHDAVTARALEVQLDRDLSAVLDADDAFRSLVSGDGTMVNSDLQRFYGVDAGSTGPNDWRAVRLAGRSGVLTHPLVMAKTGHGTDGSFVFRGLLVRKTLLCEAPPPPPPNVSQSSLTGASATLREQSTARLGASQCAGCHLRFDPIGFGFEAFDGLGRFDAAKPTSGTLSHDDAALDGPFTSVRALGERLAQSDTARACFVTQWTRFALGRTETAADRCAIEAVSRRTTAAARLAEVLSTTVAQPFFVRRLPR